MLTAVIAEILPQRTAMSVVVRNPTEEKSTGTFYEFTEDGQDMFSATMTTGRSLQFHVLDNRLSS